MSVLLLAILLLLIAINGFFVAAEFAVVRSRRARLEQMRDEGVRGAGRALDQLDRVDEFVATSQVGITLASLGIGFLGEPALATLLEPIFGFASHAVALALSIALAFIIVTFLHVILGEQSPKMIAIGRAEPTLIKVTGPLMFLGRVLHPLIVATNAPANFLVHRVLRIQVEDAEETSPEELRLIIARGARQGGLDPDEAGHLAGVFHLHEQEAREVMTPIPAVVTVDADETVEAALRRCVTSGHTRLVVIEDENPDRVKGVVHNNSLIRLFMSEGAEAPIGSVIRDALIVPETRPLDDLLHDLQVQRTSLSVVVDEYGRTIGIVTVEDILEEVVGEIEDETDPRASEVRRLTNGDWFVRGHVSLGDLEDAGIDLPDADSETYNSIGGYVFGELGRLPKRGDSIAVDGYTLRVEAVRENRIEAVRISRSGSGASSSSVRPGA
jgi:CBS domain containing-hemolysin-like protein